MKELLDIAIAVLKEIAETNRNRNLGLDVTEPEVVAARALRAINRERYIDPAISPVSVEVK